MAGVQSSGGGESGVYVPVASKSSAVASTKPADEFEPLAAAPNDNAESQVNRAGLGFYFAGTLLTQIGQAGLSVAMPLILMLVTGSATIGTASVTVAAGCAAAGQLLVFPLLMRVDFRILLLTAMVLKTGILVAITVLYEEDPGPWVAIVMVVLFCFDSMMRGGIDSLRNVLPMLFCGSDADALLGFNAYFQLVYQLAGAVGPALVGIFMTIDPAVCLIFCSCVYGGAMVGFAMMPSISHDNSAIEKAIKKKKDKKKKNKAGAEGEEADTGDKKSSGSCPGPVKKCCNLLKCKGLKDLKSLSILAPFAAQCFIQGQRLKAVLSTVFAKDIINEHTGASAGYVTAGQGVGAFVCATMFSYCYGGKSSKGDSDGDSKEACCPQLDPKWWLFVCIVGTTIRSWGWIPAMDMSKSGVSPQVAAVPYICANACYGFANNAAVMSIQSMLQKRCQNVAIITTQRFIVRLSGVITKIWVTAIIAKYEYTTGNYDDAFFDISICLTCIFVFPQVMCFLYFLCFEDSEKIEAEIAKRKAEAEKNKKCITDPSRQLRRVDSEDVVQTYSRTEYDVLGADDSDTDADDTSTLTYGSAQSATAVPPV
jgi:hypothetical protein